LTRPRLLLPVVLLLLLGLGARSPAAAERSRTVIEGAALSHAVRLSAVDEDAFSRRVSPPPRLVQSQGPPPGPVYTIASPYWLEAARSTRPDAPLPAPTARYYPSAALALVARGNEDVWLALDKRQEAILGRYLGLARSGLIPPEPGVLEVLAAAARSGEPIAVQVGDTLLSEAQAAALWEAVAGRGPDFLEPRAPPDSARDGVWVILTLAEGRAVQLFYDRSSRTLTDILGAERYAVSAALGGIIDASGGAALAVPQEARGGSLLWWPVMLGVGLAALAASVWLDRRLRRRRPGGAGG
jgi:hypothetical protein